MKKREGFLLLSVLLALFGYIFFFIAQVFPSIYQGFNKLSNNIAGNAIADIKVPYINLDLTLLIIISQGIILGFIIFAIVMRTMKNKNQKKEKINLGSFSLKKTKSQTDLDILYNIIKTKKKVSIEALSLYFNISQEKALEWAKILENEEMVTIDYPFLSNPEISFIDNKPLENKPLEKVSKTTILSKINPFRKSFPNKTENKPFNEKVSKDNKVKLVPPIIQNSKLTYDIKRRNPVLVLLFALITFGIYLLYWLYSTTNELKKSTKNAPKIWMLLLIYFLSIVLIVTFLLFTNYLMGSSSSIEINNYDKTLGLTLIITILILIGLIGIFNFIFLWKYSKAIGELNGFNNILLFALWIGFYPAALILSQIELNKRAPIINISKTIDKNQIKSPIKIVENKKDNKIIKIETNKANNKDSEVKKINNAVNNSKINLNKKPNKLFSFFKRKDKVVNNPVKNKPFNEKVSKIAFVKATKQPFNEKVSKIAFVKATKQPFNEKVSKNNSEPLEKGPQNKNKEEIDDKNKHEDFFNLDKTEKNKILSFRRAS